MKRRGHARNLNDTIWWKVVNVPV